MISLKSDHSRACALAAVLVGACIHVWGCGARSGMFDTPEDESPVLPGTGGAEPVGGSAGTVATGGTSWAGGGAGGAGGLVSFSGGAGGTRRTGGAGGTTPPATGGTGGGFLGSCAYPSCLWNLIRDCAVVGQCTEDEAEVPNGTTYVTELCCSNGVSELVTVREQGSRITATVAVTKNGSKCYDVLLTSTADGNTVNYTWVDPSGQAVAKASFLIESSSTPTVVCANGDSMEMTDECAPDGSQEAEVNPGTCR